MFRLVGMLVGSAATTLLLVLVLWLCGESGLVRQLQGAAVRLVDAGRQVHARVVETAGRAAVHSPRQEVVAAAPPTGAAVQAPARPAVPTEDRESSRPALPVAAPAPQSSASRAAEAAAPDTRVAGSAVAPRDARAADTAPVLDPTRPPASSASDVTDWHAVWTPFYSERSAQGFADRLARTTGLDYRIGRTAPGRYQVSVAVRDEADRRQRLEAISRVTGLSVEALQP